MGKSKRKTKIFGHCGNSEKKDKRLANRMFRRKQKAAIEVGEFDKIPIDMEEVCPIWSMSKDGKEYWADAPEKSMRK
jgi:hypothetical protein